MANNCQLGRPKFLPAEDGCLAGKYMQVLAGVNGKVLPYSSPSVGPRADPGVQAISSQVIISHPPDGRLPLLSTRPAVTFPAEEHHHPSASTKLCCLVTEAHGCEQLTQGCYSALRWPGLELTTTESPVRRLSH